MTCDQCQRPVNYCFYIPEEFWLKTSGTNKGHKCAHCVLEQLGGLDWLIIWNEPAEKMRQNSAIDGCMGCGRVLPDGAEFVCSKECAEKAAGELAKA